MNNKGMSLIELLVTIVFIGVILVFMFGLLNDLRGETDNNNFAYNNQVNKVDAIHAIQKDLNTYILLGIQDVSDSNIKLNFYYLKGNDKKTAVLSTSKRDASTALGGSTTNYYLNYTNVDGEKNSWEMKDAEVDSCGLFTFYNETQGTNSELNNYYFKLNIYLYNKQYHEQNNKDRNNSVDDIEITYAGYNTDLENNISYLTSGNNHIKNIGNCTN